MCLLLWCRNETCQVILLGSNIEYLFSELISNMMACYFVEMGGICVMSSVCYTEIADMACVVRVRVFDLSSHYVPQHFLWGELTLCPSLVTGK